MNKGKLENEVINDCHSMIESLQQSGELRAINYRQSVGLAFGYSQVKKIMESLPGGKQAFKKLIPTKYGIDGMPDDLMVFVNGRIIYHEYKREKGGVISDDQRKFKKICDGLSIPHAFISNSDEMIAAWEKYKLL